MACVFYVSLDDVTYGPYSTQDIIELELPPDVLVKEECMEEWLPARIFDFEELLRSEQQSSRTNLVTDPPFSFTPSGELVIEDRGGEEEGDECVREDRDVVEDRDSENPAESAVARPSRYYMNAHGELVERNSHETYTSPGRANVSSSGVSDSDSDVGWRLLGTSLVLIAGFWVGYYILSVMGSLVGVAAVIVIAFVLLRRIWKD